MNRTLVWDLPVRLFHWLFAAGFVAASVISLILGEHSPLFPYHAIIGLVLGAMVALRIVWGIAGPRWARFGSFVFGPGEIARYTIGAMVGGGRGKRYIGHNPGSAVAIFAMLALILGLTVTGIMMARGNEGPKELHELMAYAMCAVVGVHILGVVLHTVRHRENLTLSMIRGTKDVDAAEGIGSSRPVAGVVFLALVGALAAGLLRNYDAGTQSTTVPLIGAALQIGEDEGGGGGEGGEGDGEDD